jgi:hypothetical protein
MEVCGVQEELLDISLKKAILPGAIDKNALLIVAKKSPEISEDIQHKKSFGMRF